MTRNYQTPTVPHNWSESRETHPAVARAIHAISNGERSPQEIWESPTQAELNHVRMAVAEYVREGDFIAESDGCYPWGMETVMVQPAS